MVWLTYGGPLRGHPTHGTLLRPDQISRRLASVNVFYIWHEVKVSCIKIVCTDFIHVLLSGSIRLSCVFVLLCFEQYLSGTDLLLLYCSTIYRKNYMVITAQNIVADPSQESSCADLTWETLGYVCTLYLISDL